jgi:hypothetical protein
MIKLNFSYNKNEYHNIFINQWQFLRDGWPDIEKRKYNRQKIKDIDFIQEVKQKIYEKLGVLSVYFFLIVLWETVDYCAPYRNIEKGLMILCCLLLNIKKIEDKGLINIEKVHKNWMLEKFDFPYKNDSFNNNNIVEKSLKLDNRIGLDTHLSTLQKQFLGLSVNTNVNHNFDQIINNINDIYQIEEINETIGIENIDEDTDEAENVIDHKGTGLSTEYLIKWKNYSDDYNTWARIDKSDKIDCINEYFSSM